MAEALSVVQQRHSETGVLLSWASQEIGGAQEGRALGKAEDTGEQGEALRKRGSMERGYAGGAQEVKVGGHWEKELGSTREHWEGKVGATGRGRQGSTGERVAGSG